MNQKLNNICKYINPIVFAISSAMLSFQLIIEEYSIKIIILTMIISFSCAIYFYKKTYNSVYKNIKENKTFSVICIILSLIVFINLYLSKGIQMKNWCTWNINPFRIRFFLLSSIAIMYISVFIGNIIKEWILNLYKLLDSWDKKAYIVASLIGFVTILIAYNFNSNWYLQYDKVYSLDCGWCFNKIFPVSSYYDIRHPILSIFTYPIFAIVDTIVKLMFNGNLSVIVRAILLQYINIQLLILVGLQLKLITKNRVVFVMYMLSFPTILFSIFFEKYQLCVFLLVLYVFQKVNREKGKSSLISAAGCMPTSCFIGILEFFKTEKLKEKIFNVVKIVVATLLLFICLGRLHTLKYGLEEMIGTKSTFSTKQFTIKENIISTTNMIQSSFVALSSSVINEKYWWNSLTSISIIALIICCIIVVGIIKNWKNFFIKSFAIWSGFAFILFVVLKWSTKESPLFSIYFSWSLIPLFVIGLDFILEKLKLNSKIIYSIIFTLMIVVNVSTMFDISNFMQIL